VISIASTEAGIFGTLETLVQRRADASGDLAVSLFDATVDFDTPSPALATRTIPVDGLALQTPGVPLPPLSDYSLVAFDFSSLGLAVDTDSRLGLKFETTAPTTLDIAANRQDNPAALPPDPNSTYFGRDFNFGGPAGIITGRPNDVGGTFDPAYRLTVLRDVAPPPAVIPLPGTAPLLLAAMGALAVGRRRRRGYDAGRPPVAAAAS
jgi:hypothetical protein